MLTKPDAPAPTSPLKGGRSPAVKAGGMRVSKKLENTAVERNPKVHGRERTSTVSIAKMQSMSILLADALEKTADAVALLSLLLPPVFVFCLSHLYTAITEGQEECGLRSNVPSKLCSQLRQKFPAAATQGVHQKPRPTLEKIIPPKRMCIIQQPRKC